MRHRLVPALVALALLPALPAQTMMPLPPYSSTFSGSTRGFWFQAPVDFTITGLRVPDEQATGIQSVEVFILAGPPPAFPATASGGSVFYLANQPSASILPCSIQIASGDYVGILGACGTNSRNSYGTSPYTSSVDGNPVTLTRFGTQNNIYLAPAPDYWTEAGGSISRVEVYYVRGPSCSITSPVSGELVSGVVTVDHDVDHVLGQPVDATYEWSTDSGTTWISCTPGGTSVNPTLGLPTPSTGLLFDWDTVADGLGLLVVDLTDLRISVDDGSQVGECSVTGLQVDNVPPSPTCTLTLTGSPPVGGEVPFELVPDSVNGPTVDASFEWSTDGGATWSMATAGASSTNPLVGLAIGTPVTFVWNSYNDGVGLASVLPGVLLRATLTDGVAPVPGECVTAPFDVDNTALCQGICGDCNLSGSSPTVVDALVGAQIAAGLLTPGLAQEACCDVNSSTTVEILDALLMAQYAAGLGVTLGCR